VDLKLHIILNQSIMLEVTNQVFFFLLSISDGGYHLALQYLRQS
jgi:hypothetical protein